MRKFIPAVLAVAIAAAPLQAQARIGVLGGFVSSNITNSNNDGTFSNSARSGFAVGVSIAGMVSPDVSLGPEAMYVEKGEKLSSGATSASFKLGYVEVPLLLKVMLGESDTKLFVLGGPAVAFKVSCANEFSAAIGSGSSNCGTGENNSIKGTDFSLMFGAGVMISQISLSARYDLGLTDINSAANDNNPSSHNHAFLILAGLNFGPLHRQ